MCMWSLFQNGQKACLFKCLKSFPLQKNISNDNNKKRLRENLLKNIKLFRLETSNHLQLLKLNFLKGLNFLLFKQESGWMHFITEQS